MGAGLADTGSFGTAIFGQLVDPIGMRYWGGSATDKIRNPLGLDDSIADPLNAYGRKGPPHPVNSRGDVLSDDDWAATKKDTTGTLLRNWLTSGGPPKPVDPTEALSSVAKSSPYTRQASQGMGLAGLFGAGGLNMGSPMAPGVPYSAPPVSGSMFGGKGK